MVAIAPRSRQSVWCAPSARVRVAEATEGAVESATTARSGKISGRNRQRVGERSPSWHAKVYLPFKPSSMEAMSRTRLRRLAAHTKVREPARLAGYCQSAAVGRREEQTRQQYTR